MCILYNVCWSSIMMSGLLCVWLCCKLVNEEQIIAPNGLCLSPTQQRIIASNSPVYTDNVLSILFPTLTWNYDTVKATPVLFILWCICINLNIYRVFVNIFLCCMWVQNIFLFLFSDKVKSTIVVLIGVGTRGLICAPPNVKLIPTLLVVLQEMALFD